MPTYVYRCSKCDATWEINHSIKDNQPQLHGPCGMIAVRVPQPVGVALKGDGWASKEGS